MRVLITTMLASLAMLVASAALAARPVYRIELVENHAGLHAQTAEAISRRGEMAGSADVAGSWETVGYRYRDGKLKRLPDSLNAVIAGINQSGDVVGRVYFDSFIWHADGTREALPETWMEDINHAGQVAGSVNDTQEAVVYDHGVLRRLGKLPGGAQSRAIAINDWGQVAGTADLDNYARAHAFVWKDGRMTDLGTFGGDNSYAGGINARGHVAGMAQGADGRENAFVHDGTTMRLVPTTKDGVRFIVIDGMNDHDELVGPSASGPLLHARNGQTYVLADLLDDSGAEWASLLTARAINDRGQIVGIGVRQGYYRAYIATPVSR